MTPVDRHDGSPGKGASTIVRMPMIVNRSGHYWSAGGHHDQNLEDITKAEKRLKKSGFRTLSALPIVAPVADGGDGCYEASMSELLFSYGTLRQPEVQLATFGRELDGYIDAVIGYELHHLTITDPQVIATSGSDRHPILRPSDRPHAHVDGIVFAITDAELVAADAYEVDDYRRISVPLRSGPYAWVYVFAG
jgi:hypothetical protein